MSEKIAQLHFALQKNSAEVAMYKVRGVGILAVEDSINAAMDGAKGSVNSALGFALI